MINNLDAAQYNPLRSSIWAGAVTLTVGSPAAGAVPLRDEGLDGIAAEDELVVALDQAWEVPEEVGLDNVWATVQTEGDLDHYCTTRDP